MVTKNRPGKIPQAGITLSPACLAIYLTWLQAGRLKSPRDKSCSYSHSAFPSRRASDNRLKATLRGLDDVGATAQGPYRVVFSSYPRQAHPARLHNRVDGGTR